MSIVLKQSIKKIIVKTIYNTLELLSFVFKVIL